MCSLFIMLILLFVYLWRGSLTGDVAPFHVIDVSTDNIKYLIFVFKKKVINLDNCYLQSFYLV